jgi:hypothetical protein
MELHAIPGALQLVTCLSQIEKYELASATFEIVFNSFEPVAGEYIARAPLPAPSVLTMYSGRDYTGTARVLSKDIANLAMSGWGNTAASLVVDGMQGWEVCEGANYTGTCRTVMAAHASETMMNMPLGSVRRIEVTNGFAGILSTGIRRSFRETVLQAIRP